MHGQKNIKFVQWEPNCCVRTDGRRDRRRDVQTDVTKLIDACRNFAIASKMHAHPFNTSNSSFRITGSCPCKVTPFSASKFSSSDTASAKII